LAGKTVFITGGSRGIGREIGLRAAKDGANVVIAAKTAQPHPKLQGTIHSVAAEIEAAGGRGLALQCDVRFEEQVAQAVATTERTFGGIDVLVNNASAISLTNTEQTTMKRFDLMQQVNARATYLVTKCCLPALRRSSNPHVLTLSPPLNLEAKWFGAHLGYTLSKFGMSMCVLGHASEFAPMRIAVNALWPRTIIATAAIANMPNGKQMLMHARSPAIMADAAHVILTKSSAEFTGNFCLDEDVLRDAGVSDFARYAVEPGSSLLPDLFI
jgi:citronellol/citronellal dehydrogenase